MPPLALAAWFPCLVRTQKGNDGTGRRDRIGHTQVFQINASTGQWAKVGADIDGEAAYDLSGSSVSLSADISVVAVSVWLPERGSRMLRRRQLRQLHATTPGPPRIGVACSQPTPVTGERCAAIIIAGHGQDRAD